MAWIKTVLKVVVTAIIANTALRWWKSPDLNEFYRGKRVILTGASRGIGKDLALQLAQFGARQVITARSKGKLEETASECWEHSGEVYTVVADLGEEEDCKRAVEEAVKQLGGVDIVIINAAHTPEPQWFSNVGKDTRQWMMNTYSVNVLQGAHLVQYSLQYLNESRGIIVPVSSLAGMQGMPKVLAYSASKHAMNGFFQGLRQEFKLTNTQVDITIMPLPFVSTERAVKNWKPKGALAAGFTPDECAHKMLAGIPLRQGWYYIDWSGYIFAHLGNMFPDTSEYIVRFYVTLFSENFS